jgi:hypothetical protein
VFQPFTVKEKVDESKKAETAEGEVIKPSNEICASV